MKHVNNFETFNEHVYAKALATHSTKWAENYKSLLSHLKKQIEDRQLKNFSENGDIVSFSINHRKYKINKKSKLFLYKKEKDDEGKVNEKEFELDLTSDQVADLIKALKKPLNSPKAAEPSKKHPKGRKPYLVENMIHESDDEIPTAKLMAYDDLKDAIRKIKKLSPEHNTLQDIIKIVNDTWFHSKSRIGKTHFRQDVYLPTDERDRRV